MRGRRDELVLAIHPSSRGFAFALFESPLSPVDWGIKEFRGEQKHSRSLGVIRRIIEQHQPDVLVLKAPRAQIHRPWHHSSQVQRFVRGYATELAIEVKMYAGEDIRACFASAGTPTRYEIAEAIARQIDAFAHQLPPMRKPWMSEDPRMKLFDAVSLAMTYFCNQPGQAVRPAA
jgi:hypothetical protein